MILLDWFLSRAFKALVKYVRWNLSRVLYVHEFNAINDLVRVNGCLAAAILSHGII